MLNINTNYASAFASNAAKTASKGLESAMEKLSSGSRINYAKDDAAGQAISTRLSAEIQGLEMASRNAADAQSLLDTAEGALQETSNVLLRMRELAVQSANGTLTDTDRGHIDAEFQQLMGEIDRISTNTTFAGQELLDGSYTSVDFQVGAGAGEVISVSIAGASSSDIGTTTGAAAVAFVNLARRHAWLDTISVHPALRSVPAVWRRELHVRGNTPIGELVLLPFKLPVLVDELGFDDRDLKIESDPRGEASIELVAELSFELPIGVKLSSAVAGDLGIALERRVPRERPQDRKGELWLEVDSESSAA